MNSHLFSHFLRTAIGILKVWLRYHDYIYTSGEYIAIIGAIS